MTTRPCPRAGFSSTDLSLSRALSLPFSYRSSLRAACVVILRVCVMPQSVSSQASLLGSAPSAVPSSVPSLVRQAASLPTREYIVKVFDHLNLSDAVSSAISPMLRPEIDDEQKKRLFKSIIASTVDATQAAFDWYEAVAGHADAVGRKKRRTSRHADDDGSSQAPDDDDDETAVAPLSQTEAAAAMRRPMFGFSTSVWPRMTWTSEATRAVRSTFDTLIIGKLRGAEAITTRVLADVIASEQDTWLGTIPTRSQIKKLNDQLRRLYARYRSLGAPAGAAGAIATAIDKAFESQHMDKTFRTACEQANKLEALILSSSGTTGLAAAATPGGLAYLRHNARSGGPGGRGNGQGRGGGGKGGRGEVTCFYCKEKGHPKRLCPKLAKKGDKQGEGQDDGE